MIEFHKSKNATVTIALTGVENPREYGVAILKDDKIMEFIEKPANPPSNLINSGYYIQRKSSQRPALSARCANRPRPSCVMPRKIAAR